MKRVLLAAVSVACLTTPAFANPIMKNSPDSAQVYGDGSAAQAQHQTAIGGSSTSTAYGGNVTVNVRGGNRGNGTGRATGLASTPTSGNAGTTGTAGVVAGAGFGRVDARQAPDVIPPAVGGGGFDCPVVGVSPGGSGLGGGGAVGVSWISSDCNARKLSEMLSALGYKDASVQLLKDHFDEVKKAFDEVQHPGQAEQDKPGFFDRLFGGPAVQSSTVAAVSYQPANYVSLAPKMTKKECMAAMGNPNLNDVSRAYVEAQCHF